MDSDSDQGTFSGSNRSDSDDSFVGDEVNA
jgi:hypothetical protein